MTSDPPSRDSFTLRATSWLRSHAGRGLFGVIMLWAVHAYAVYVLANAISHDPGQALWPNWRQDLHGWVTDVNAVPPVARFDSVWYYSIATDGYPGTQGLAVYNAGFLPLYGLLMRWVGAGLGMEPYLAGVWISRIATLVGLILLYLYALRRPELKATPWAPVAALLFFPTGYLLVSVYAEALFFACLMATFYFAERRWFLAAFVAAFFAGLTRAHVLALIPAMFVLGVIKFREKRSVAVALPMLGGITAILSLGYYFKRVANDPLLYVHRKAFFGSATGGPLVTIATTRATIRDALERGTLGATYTLLEFPCAVILSVAALYCVWKKHWAEAVLLAGTVGLNMMAGSLWGLPRYSIVMFPLFLLIGRLAKRPLVFSAYMVVGALTQALLLANYVNFRAPAP